MDRETESVIRGVESLSSSPPPAVSLSSCLSLPVSCSSSPLVSSRKVTERLYSSLQNSREQELKGHRDATHHTLTGRQVSFKPKAPLVAMTTVAPSLWSDRPNDSQEVEIGLNPDSSNDLRVSGLEEAESESEPVSEEMELNVENITKLQSGQRHIQEMENVRSHLHTMLRARDTDTHDLLSTLQHLQDSESDTTSHLLSGVEELFPRYSRLRADFESAPFHSISELQVIRESLEKERERRRHLEQQLLAVQNKALGLQQQLALAVSADHKKDIMIEQIDKTLEKVVQGWRRHEQEKTEGVRLLQEEKETAETTLQKQRETLACLEKNLSEATEMLDKEQKWTNDLQNTKKQLECDVAGLRVCVGELEMEVKHLHTELEKKKAEVEGLQTHTVSLQQQLEKHNLEAKHLQQELTQITQQLETEREQVRQELQLREEAQSRVQQLQQDLEETRRERDTTRVDRALDQARFEAQRSQWEVDHRLSVEQQVTERLVPIQEENANATAKLREQHRKQLLDLNARHERDLTVKEDGFRAQLKERDDTHTRLILEFNSKIVALQDELVSMETSKRRLETQREELVSRLQGMMRSHWAEALRLLTNQEQTEGVLSPSFLQGVAKPYSTPQTQDSSTAHTHSTAAPQSVVLQLCREREQRIIGKSDIGCETVRVESDFSLLNHSNTFSPLEPVLDETQLTGIGGDHGDLWERPVGGEKLIIDRRREQTQCDRGREMIESGENLTLHSTHFQIPDLYCTVNQDRIQSDHRMNRQPYPNTNPSPTRIQNPNLNQNPTLNPHHKPRPNRAHASTDLQANQSTQKWLGPCDVSKQMCNITETRAPPTEEQMLSVKMKAPPPTSKISSLCDERQNELQYYIAKLLERSPGEPLEEPQVDHSKNITEARSTNPGVSFQLEPNLEQLTELLQRTLPSLHTSQQLQQLLNTYISVRSGDTCADPVRANLDRKLAQHDKKESAARSVQNTGTRGRRAGLQSQKSGSKANAWR